jgi:hypothetical protein
VTMVKRMVVSTFNFSNVHWVVDDNSNPYRNMVMDAMRMNQGYVGECLVIDEEPNAYVASFLFIKRLRRTIMGWVHKS